MYKVLVYMCNVLRPSGGRFKRIIQERNRSSTEESMQRVDLATTHACMNNLYKNKLHNKTCTIITFITFLSPKREQ